MDFEKVNPPFGLEKITWINLLIVLLPVAIIFSRKFVLKNRDKNKSLATLTLRKKEISYPKLRLDKICSQKSQVLKRIRKHKYDLVELLGLYLLCLSCKNKKFLWGSYLFLEDRVKLNKLEKIIFNSLYYTTFKGKVLPINVRKKLYKLIATKICI